MARTRRRRTRTPPSAAVRVASNLITKATGAPLVRAPYHPCRRAELEVGREGWSLRS
uniref:Uncharacterized protein n=1 Tax=Arundo donax TaxID=35708 RepID=A0A0A9GGS8_ARUDO